MIRMTRNELVDYLKNITGSTFIGVTVNTIPKMRKTNNPFFNRINKRNTIGGIVNFHYDEGVLRRLEKEGKSPDDFKRGTSWHEPILNNNRLTPLCKHKDRDEYYLRLQLTTIGDPKYLDIKTNTEVDKQTISDFLSEQSSYSNQGLDSPLKILTYSINSIDRISIKGEEILVR
jgi:hypothetical protein